MKTDNDVHLVIGCFVKKVNNLSLYKISRWLENLVIKQWGDPNSIVYIGSDEYKETIRNWSERILFCKFSVREMPVSSPRSFLLLLKKLSPRKHGNDIRDSSKISMKADVLLSKSVNNNSKKSPRSIINDLGSTATHVIIFDENGHSVELYKLLIPYIENIVMISMNKTKTIEQDKNNTNN